MNASERTYEGVRLEAGCKVTVDGRKLRPRLDLENHSPTGFEWGYAGSGPAQLALAILADHLADDALAVRWHQRFKFDVIAPLAGERWRMTRSDVQDWCRHQTLERP